MLLKGIVKRGGERLSGAALYIVLMEFRVAIETRILQKKKELAELDRRMRDKRYCRIHTRAGRHSGHGRKRTIATKP